MSSKLRQEILDKVKELYKLEHEEKNKKSPIINLFGKKNKNNNVEKIKEMIREDTILVSVCSVDSELGIRQPIEEIGEVLKDYKTGKEYLYRNGIIINRETGEQIEKN